jgi:hypothetical protein
MMMIDRSCLAAAPLEDTLRTDAHVGAVGGVFYPDEEGVPAYLISRMICPARIVHAHNAIHSCSIVQSGANPLNMWDNAKKKDVYPTSNSSSL